MGAIVRQRPALRPAGGIPSDGQATRKATAKCAVQVGPEARGVVVSGNRFSDVAMPYALSAPEFVKVIE